MPGTAPLFGLLLGAVAPAQTPAVVHVFVEAQGERPFRILRPGSGVVFDPAGLVVTHQDLIAAEGSGPNRTFVQLADADRTRLPARVVRADAATQLVLLHVEPPAGTTLTALPLAGDPPPGTPALVLGFPDGEDHVAFAGVTSWAQRTPQRLELRREDILLTDAAIQARSHGAALLDSAGALLGICSAAWVQPDKDEPTIEDLKRASYGVVIPARVVRAAFAAELGHLPPAASVPGSPEAAAVAAAAPSIVAVRAGTGTAQLEGDDPYATIRRPGCGSGVVIGAGGLVLTNLHLVEGADAIAVTWLDGGTAPAEVVRSHVPTNTALLRVRVPAGRDLVPIRLAAGPPPVGATLLAVGNPEGHTLAVGRGVFSALRGGMLQTDAPLGNHTGGGALIDLSGALVALVDAGRVDPLDVAWSQRGVRFKLDTSLNLTPGIERLRSVLQLTDLPVAPADSTPASPTAAAMTRVGDAVLNLFVEASTAAAELEDNPFAQPTAKTTILSLGSGVIIDPRGLALTNEHVVREATFPDGSMRPDRVLRATRRDGRAFAVQVLSLSREDDLALLQLAAEPGERLPHVEFGSSSALPIGAPVIAAGNPHGRANTVTAGVITAKNQVIRIRGRWAKMRHVLETDAAINGGNSGGPLLDAEGRLLGINSAGGDLRAITGFAIVVEHVRERLYGLLLSPAKLRSPYAGIDVVERDGAVAVQAVHPYGPAAGAGLAPGDVVEALGETPIHCHFDFALALRACAPGAPVALHAARGGTALTAELKPWAAPVWAVFQQTDLVVEELTVRGDAELVHAAALATHRHRTGEPDSAPAVLPESVVRIAALHPGLAARGVDVRPGDVLAGVVLRERTGTGDVETLIRFATPADVQRCVNEHCSYDGTMLTAWVFRTGAIVPIALPARRLMP